MSSAALARESVDRVGALVRAPGDRQHTDRGRVLELNDFAPVALVRFSCGCRAYVPLRRLVIDLGPPEPACEAGGCPNPRWKGPYCTSHRAPPTTKASASAGTRAQAAGPGMGSPGPATERAAVIPLPPPESQGAGTPAARSGAARLQAAPNRRALKWTREAIIAAFKAWAEEHGEAPAPKQWARAAPGRPCMQTVFNVFGSWPAACTAAGLVSRGPDYRRWSPGQIIASMQAWAAEHGRSPSFDHWRVAEPGHPSAATVVNVMGSWSKALEAAGLAPTIRQPWSVEEIAASIRAVAEVLGRAPSSDEWRERKARPSLETIYNRAGSWRAALAAAGLEPLRSGPRPKVTADLEARVKQAPA